MTPLERAARAIFRADYPDHVDANFEIDEAGTVMWEKRRLWYGDAARAVLKAMREPSDNMVEAGQESLDGFDPSPEAAWRLMIDSALHD